MRRTLALAALALSCSSDPAQPVDADAGQDVAVDLGGPLDTGAVDAGPGDTGTDAGPPPDADPCGGACGPGTQCEASRCVVVDAGQLDTGEDVSLPADQGAGELDAAHDSGVDVPRVGLDTGPRDTGPVDAQGVLSYPLDPPPGETQVRVLIDRICLDGTRCGVTLTEASMVACSLVGTQLSFSVRACTPGSSPTCSTVTGLFPAAPSTTGASVGMFSGQAFQATDLGLRAGARVGARQSFHVQFRVPYTSSNGGYAGTPGRTVDPERADVWLLGCTVR